MQRDNVRDILVALLLAAAIASLVWPAKVAPWVFAPWGVSWAAPGGAPAVVGGDPPIGAVR